ncbi:MAG: putative RelASpoT domain-containing protein [Nitrospira sp.]|nr:MAG: putative RelASpoT domain-containing protein [Nitrospira sp.]
MNEADLREAFESRKPALEALGAWVTKTIIGELQKQLGSQYAVEKYLQIPPKPRVKSTDSFLEKALLRKRKADPLSEITDQVGVRFVVLLLQDIDRVGKIVQSDRWLWQKDRDHEQERLEKPDYFAYQSDHYVIHTRESFEFMGVTIPGQTPCEIQIRTILQHAYAEMAHGSVYKPSIRLPENDEKRVKRSLAKGSALIETTDDVFKEIQNQLREYDESVHSLLVRSSGIYQAITGEQAAPVTPLGQLIADTYRGLLKALTPEKLDSWADARPWLGINLRKKRSQSVFYRDPVVILLGWLVTEHETSVPKLWPVDSSYLEEFYSLMGISPNGLF